MVLSSVTQPDKGLVTIKDNKVMYKAASVFSGVITFNYIVNAMDTGHVTVTVVAQTTTPSADHTPPVRINGIKILFLSLEKRPLNSVRHRLLQRMQVRTMLLFQMVVVLT